MLCCEVPRTPLLSFGHITFTVGIQKYCIVLVLLALDEVRVNLHYVGEPEQLRVALGQVDLSMVQEEGEWVIYLADLVKP